MKRMLSIIGAVVMMASFLGGAYFLEDRYAKADDLKQNYRSDNISDLQSNIRWYQDQMRYIMTRCGKRDPKNLPEWAFHDFERYRIDKEKAEAILNAIMIDKQ